MIACAVGDYSFEGKQTIMLDVEEVEPTPLVKKLERVASIIGWIGLAMACLTVLALFARWAIHYFTEDIPWDSEYLSTFLDYLIIGITVIVVAVPEGLPLAVALCLAFSIGKMA
mmetsp:Transcript_8063/g.4267  ORF Transcript_8063/g.4267 Transcript_8063/m.4267 type:complete len:114 (-) Transcript_8063:217-558(-)